ncbi:SlyX family protein [Notoacmeibacter ruber]|uniref:SlyX family protein n=1 Tax=Notoacmeibacter ruber TaxID=2670375 RepID=A0A3L7JEP1_9HYPH|nr:SlyX family protein [Notoacmeibacter ruber]RLQ89258.1 hypothetical protein D8780_14415 [Notoacmeibacter ruber]
MSEADSVVELQSRVAELERELETLSTLATEQAHSIASLENKLMVLIQRFLVVESQSGGDVPIDKPPHW